MRRLLTFCLTVLVAIGAHGGSLSDLLPGIHENELARLKSPDGKATAILIHKESRGFPLPGPEPPKTLGRWSRLKVVRDDKTVYDSGDERLNIYQMSPGFAVDLMWSPDSSCLAYRHIAALRVIGTDGKVTTHDPSTNGALVASFRWVDNTNLLVVSREGQSALGLQGEPPQYEGYIDKARVIRIALLNVVTGYSDCHRQVVSGPTFLFHSIAFCLDEISPKGDRVAFSDGANLCIYDVGAGRVVTETKIPQKPAPKPDPRTPGMEDPFAKGALEQMAASPAQLEGLWWQNNDRLVIGVGLLGGPVESFYTYNVPEKVLTDRTDLLLPVWSKQRVTSYQDPDWYRVALK